MNFKQIDLSKWFYYDVSNYGSCGHTFMLTKCNVDFGRKSYTNSVKLVKLSKANTLEDIILPIDGVTSGCICYDSQSCTIYNYRKDGQLFFRSTLTDKQVVKTPNTSVIPWNGCIIIAEHQGTSFDYEDTIYECYDGRLNLMWQYLHHGFVNEGAYKVYKDYIEIGTDEKLFFNEKGISEGVKPAQSPISLSDWYINDEDRSLVKQVDEKCASCQSLAKSLFNGKEYVLHCNSTDKQYIAKFSSDFKLIWKRELPDCIGTYRLLYSDGIYFSIGCKLADSFYICMINEEGEMLEQSENIEANEAYCHIVGGQLVVFYNRTDNLSKPEKQLVKDGVMMANGYCLVVDCKPCFPPR